MVKTSVVSCRDESQASKPGELFGQNKLRRKVVETKDFFRSPRCLADIRCLAATLFGDASSYLEFWMNPFWLESSVEQNPCMLQVYAAMNAVSEI